MVRFYRSALLLLIAFLFVATASFGTTYYIAANGSDSNNGTAKTTPWLHAPGMTGCTGTCASKKPAAGDRFILRGGDTWWNVNAGTPSGLPWTINWNGTSGNTIYFGVDQTWYNSATCGSAWCRPIMNMGNPVSTTSVSSCKYDTKNSGNSNNVAVFQFGSYVQVDNLEFTGLCWSSYTFAWNAYVQSFGSNAILSNLYTHGWSHTASTSDGGTSITGTTQNQATYNQVVNLVCDGSDTDRKSTYCIYGDLYDIHGSTFRYVPNGAVGGNCKTIHDNLFEYLGGSFDPTMHNNGFECNNSVNEDGYYYNNLVRHTTTAVTVWTCARQTDYVYNNVVYDVASQGWDIATSQQSPCAGGGTTKFYNNTFAGRGAVAGDTVNSWSGTFTNNLWIDGASPSGSGWTQTNGVTLTAAQATTYGYTAASNYAPASDTCNGNSSAATCPIAKGANLSTVCSATPSSGLCMDTSAGNTSTPTERTSSWDIGAFQSGNTSAQTVQPPSGLVAIVN